MHTPATIKENTLIDIYDQYHQPIYRFVYYKTSNVEVARDLTADVFQRLVKTTQQKDISIEQISPWLYRTAQNIVIDYYRKQKFRQHLPLAETLIDDNETPIDTVERKLSAQMVRDALHALTPEQQQVIELKFLQELSNKETAEVMNKPVTAVKALQHRAVAALQRYLNGDTKVTL